MSLTALKSSSLSPIGGEGRGDGASPIETLEARLLPLPQADIPLTHRFAPGVYMREVLMPAGTFVIGHQHKTEHLNIVLTGRARVMQIAESPSPPSGERGGVMGQEIEEIVAPYTFVSKPGVRKVLYILEDMRWATIHPTTETDLAKLEDLLIIKSEAFLDRQEAMAALSLSPIGGEAQGEGASAPSLSQSQIINHQSMEELCPG